jgi:hypothetical protein
MNPESTSHGLSQYESRETYNGFVNEGWDAFQSRGISQHKAYPSMANDTGMVFFTLPRKSMGLTLVSIEPLMF